ncbi:MAG: carboxypeptidase regulatory-like domain-containing protein, partial [Terriglobales bacterium]
MKIPVRILVLVAIVTLICVAANAQRESGSISGTILDPTGAVVSGATVVVKNQATGAIRTVTTGSNGDYAVPDLPPAPYQVTVTAAGFAEYKQSLVVAVGSTNGVSPHLTLATAKGTVVEVTGGGEVAVETQTSEVSQEVNPTQMNELPSINRDPYALVAIAGNVTADMAGRGAGAAINGQRSASTDILLDGGENVDLFSASVGQSVPMDSVQEFSVSTSNFSAEYGRASGGIVNVATKSGSNSFHGTAYDYNRVAALASNTYDNKAQSTPVPRAPFTHNQFGYSVGGPVVKNKLFFFNSTEWLRVRSNASTEGYVPDPTFLSTYGASNVQSYFNQYGVLKPTTTFIPAGAITAGALGLTGIPAAQNVFDLATYQFPADVGGLPPQNTWNSVIRVDYNLSDKTQMFGRYTAFHDDFFPGNNSASAYSGWDTGINDLNQNVMFSLTHLWTNSFVTNTKISLNRLVDHQPLGTNGVAPGLFAGTGGDGYGIGSSVFMLPGYLPYAAGGAIPFGGPQNVSDFEHSFSWTHGKHSFKFGGEYLYIRDNREFGAYETGYEFLDGGGSNASVANALISGNLYGFTTAINPQGTFPCFRDPNLNTIIQTAACTLTGPATAPSFSRSNRYNDGSLYFQDNWKVTPRLTLNLGLRWEYFGVQHAKY